MPKNKMAAVLVAILFIMSYRDSNDNSITGTRTRGVGVGREELL